MPIIFVKVKLLKIKLLKVKPLEDIFLDKIIAVFGGGNRYETERKHTMRFDERPEMDEHGRQFCRNIYVQKNHLEKLGWKPGMTIKVTIELN